MIVDAWRCMDGLVASGVVAIIDEKLLKIDIGAAQDEDFTPVYTSKSRYVFRQRTKMQGMSGRLQLPASNGTLCRESVVVGQQAEERYDLQL
jgi:hypothetical protein